MYSKEKNDAILKKWNYRALSNKDGEISPDGVYFKGELYNFYEGREDFTQMWRKPGEEDYQWNNSERRILFVSKDPEEPDNPYDRRGPDLFRGKDDSLSFGCRFNRNMTRITTGISNVNEDWFPSFEDVNNVEYVEDCWLKAAVGRINLKKHGGGNKISNNVLQNAIKGYRDLILEQLNLLSPNIIICCGASGIIKDFIISGYLKEDPEELKSPDDNWIYYSKNKGIWIIDSYHMNPYGYSTDKSLYENIVINFQKSLKRINRDTIS